LTLIGWSQWLAHLMACTQSSLSIFKDFMFMGEDKGKIIWAQCRCDMKRSRPTYGVWVDLLLDIEVLSILAQDVHKNQGCQNSCCAHYPTNLSFQNQFCNVDEFFVTKNYSMFNIFQISILKFKKSCPWNLNLWRLFPQYYEHAQIFLNVLVLILLNKIAQHSITLAP